MNKTSTFEQFLANQTPHIELMGFTVNLVLTFILCTLLAYIYTGYGSSLSNRKMFSRNLVIIGMTTMVIITIVKSSLALSLGLVGALSIVRFRTPIKEPEELSFLFLSIALGLGMGASQREVTVIGFFIIGAVILFRKKTTFALQDQSCLSISLNEKNGDILEKIAEILGRNATSIRLNRFDASETSFEADFLLTIDSLEDFSSIKDKFHELEPRLKIVLLDNRI